MRWEQPYWLLLALPALAAAWRAWRGDEKERASLAYPSLGDLLALAKRSESALARRLPQALKVSALLLAVLAMARPQKVSRQAMGLTQGIDILLALDTSTSMRALDFDPLNRMDAAKNAAKDFISRRVSDRIGILVFAGDPVLTCPLTLDYDALLGFLDQVQPGMTRSDGTAIGDGIASAVNHLKESSAKSKVIILLTDGANNAGLVDPLTAAKAAKAYGIKIYTIGTGKRGEALVPVDDPNFGRRLARIPDELDEDMLAQIAGETGGQYFRATSVKELADIYKQIDRMEKTAIKAPDILSYTDLYPWLLVPAAALLALEMALSRTWLLRIP